MSTQSILMLLEGNLKIRLGKLIDKGADVRIADDGIYVYDNKGLLLLRVTPNTYEKRKHLI